MFISDIILFAMSISCTVALHMAYPSYRPPPSPTPVSSLDRLQQKAGLFKLAELRAVLRHAGLNSTGNKSRVLQSVQNLITQNNKLAIEKINATYNQCYGDNVRVPTSTMQERRVPPSHPPVSYTQTADRPCTSPSFQFRKNSGAGDLEFPTLLGEKLSTVFHSIIACQAMPSSAEKRLVSFRFSLSPSEAHRLTEESHLTTRIVFRICKRHDYPVTDQVPSGICSFKVNGTSIVLVQSPEKFEYRHTSRSIDITNQVKNGVLSHSVELYYLPRSRDSIVSMWRVAVEIIQFDVPLLISSLPVYSLADTEKRIKQAFNSDPELSITTTSINFSLKCPLTGLPIQLPCRSSRCQHLQCFDGRALICMGVETQKWICPICSTPIPYASLLTDEYFQEIVSERREPLSEIFLFEDGHWSPTAKPALAYSAQIILDCSNSSAPPPSPTLPSSPYKHMASSSPLSIDIVKITSSRPVASELSIIEIID